MSGFKFEVLQVVNAIHTASNMHIDVSNTQDQFSLTRDGLLVLVKELGMLAFIYLVNEIMSIR